MSTTQEFVQPVGSAVGKLSQRLLEVAKHDHRYIERDRWLHLHGLLPQSCGVSYLRTLNDYQRIADFMARARDVAEVTVTDVVALVQTDDEAEIRKWRDAIAERAHIWEGEAAVVALQVAHQEVVKAGHV